MLLYLKCVYSEEILVLRVSFTGSHLLVRRGSMLWRNLVIIIVFIILNIRQLG